MQASAIMFCMFESSNIDHFKEHLQVTLINVHDTQTTLEICISLSAWWHVAVGGCLLWLSLSKLWENGLLFLEGSTDKYLKPFEHNKFWYESVALLCRLHKSCTSVWDAGCAFLGMHFQMLATLILWVCKPTSQRAKKLRDRTRILKALHDWRMILDMSRTREIAESPVVLSVGLGCHGWGLNKVTVWHSEHLLPCLQLVPPPSADHFHPSRCGQRVLLKTFYPGKFHASTTDNKKM